MSEQTKTSATALVGVALVGSLGLVQAAENPFAIEPLGASHVLLAETDGEGQCGEGQCGGDKGTEGRCGGATDDGKGTEGKCGSGS